VRNTRPEDLFQRYLLRFAGSAAEAQAIRERQSIAVLLDTFVVFEAVARHGGFAAAAAELRLSPATVEARVADLERELRLALFRRARGRFGLTANGTRLAEAVRGALERIAGALGAATDAAPAAEQDPNVIPLFARSRR